MSSSLLAPTTRPPGAGGPQSLPDTDLANDVICTSTDVHQESFDAVFRRAHPAQLLVPLFQRRYCWEQPQWAKLMSDVEGAASSGKQLFLGRVLVFVGPNDPRTLVCDGQQRLVSLTLLLAALRDAALELGGAEGEALAGEVDGMLFLDAAARDRTTLVPTNDDRAAYAVALARRGEPPAHFGFGAAAPAAAGAGGEDDGEPDSDTSTGEKLLACKHFFVERVRAHIELHVPPSADAAARGAAARERVAALVDGVRTRCGLVWFKLKEDEQVHRVFEEHAHREKALKTLWNFDMPGMQVAGCDLIRNLLLSAIQPEGAQRGVHDKLWVPMERAATGGSGAPFDLEAFFMTFLHAVGYSVGARPELYSGFRSWLERGLLDGVARDDGAAVTRAVSEGLQTMLTEARKWEAHVHRREQAAA